MKNNYIPVVNHSLKYNPSIDGLRGISISLVLLFHVWPNYFSFGYVGVDIFVEFPFPSCEFESFPTEYTYPFSASIIE